MHPSFHRSTMPLLVVIRKLLSFKYATIESGLIFLMKTEGAVRSYRARSLTFYNKRISGVSKEKSEVFRVYLVAQKYMKKLT